MTLRYQYHFIYALTFSLTLRVKLSRIPVLDSFGCYIWVENWNMRNNNSVAHFSTPLWERCNQYNITLALPYHGFFFFQIIIKVIAFQEIISALRLVVSKGVRPPWGKLMNITIGIRHNTLDYSDKFQWDVLSETGEFIMDKVMPLRHAISLQ